MIINLVEVEFQFKDHVQRSRVEFSDYSSLGCILKMGSGF